MGDVVEKEHLAVARNFKILNKLSDEWLAEEGIKDTILSLVGVVNSSLPKGMRDRVEEHVLSACRLCFEDGAYRGYCAGSDGGEEDAGH